MLHKLTCGNSYYIRYLQNCSNTSTTCCGTYSHYYKSLKYLILGLEICVILFKILPRNWL